MPPNWKSGSISLSIETKEIFSQQRIKTEMCCSAKLLSTLVTFTPLAPCPPWHKQCSKWRNHCQIWLSLLFEGHHTANFFMSLLAVGGAIVKHDWILLGHVRNQGAIWMTACQSHSNSVSDLINQSIRGIRSECDTLCHLTIGVPVSEILFRTSFWKSDKDGTGNGATRMIESETVNICWKKHKVGFISVESIILLQGLSFTLRQIHLVLQGWCVSYKVITNINNGLILRFTINFLVARPCTFT